VSDENKVNKFIFSLQHNTQDEEEEEEDEEDEDEN
jgi:hypothetical protein